MSTAPNTREPTPDAHTDSDGEERPPIDSSYVSDPPSRSPSPSPAAESGNENRQLDVADALAFLDALKAHFHGAPDIYNQFLDTMKAFKNEQLDTPGVMERVETLLAGAPDLLSRFNIFLPAGYRIECAAPTYAETARPAAFPRPRLHGFNTRRVGDGASRSREPMYHKLY